MSTEYMPHGGVGILLRLQDIPDKYKRVTPEQFHMEARFDTKTGQKLRKMEKVVDKEEEKVFLVNGEEYDLEDAQDFFDIVLLQGEKSKLIADAHHLTNVLGDGYPVDTDAEDGIFYFLWMDIRDVRKALDQLERIANALLGLEFKNVKISEDVWVEAY